MSSCIRQCTHDCGDDALIVNRHCFLLIIMLLTKLCLLDALSTILSEHDILVSCLYVDLIYSGILFVCFFSSLVYSFRFTSCLMHVIIKIHWHWHSRIWGLFVFVLCEYTNVCTYMMDEIHSSSDLKGCCCCCKEMPSRHRMWWKASFRVNMTSCNQ